MQTSNPPVTPELAELSSAKMTYEDYGRTCAMRSMASPEILEGTLANVYDDLMQKNKLSEDEIKKRVAALDNEILSLDQNIHQKQSEISQKRNDIDRANRIIEEIREKIVNVREHLPTLETISFSICVFLAFTLAAYLFVFYSSTGYSAFYGVGDSTGFIHAGVFREARLKGGEVLAMFILFPIIFLSLGFLIHAWLEKKKYLLLVLLLVFTFAFDAMIAFKIASNIYANRYVSGEVTEPWKFEMAYTDVNFWIIIAAGFVVYIIWGFILHYVMSEYNKTRPGQREQAALEKFRAEISTKEDEINRLRNEINQLEADTEKIRQEKTKKEKEKNDYLSGRIQSIITNSKLAAAVGEFMKGWTSFIAFHWTNDPLKRNALTREANNISTSWTARTLSELVVINNN